MVDFTALIATAQRLITANGRSVTFVTYDSDPVNNDKPWLGPLDPRADASLAALLAATSGHDAAIFDIQDITTLWQDNGKTIPANTIGDPVQKVEDVSGNGYDAAMSNGTAGTLQNDGERYYIQMNSSGEPFSSYASTFTGGTDVSFAMAWRQESGDLTSRIILDNLGFGPRSGWFLEGGTDNVFSFLTGDGAAYSANHTLDGLIELNIDTMVFGQISSNDFLISKRGEADATSAVETYLPNVAPEFFILNTVDARWYRLALVDTILSASERATFESWAVSALGGNQLVVDAVFVPPASASQLGLGAKVSDLLKRSEQIMIVSAGAAVDLRDYHELIDDGSRWKIDHIEILKPATDIVVSFVGVSR